MEKERPRASRRNSARGLAMTVALILGVLAAGWLLAAVMTVVMT
jgi:hypothetical protein